MPIYEHMTFLPKGDDKNVICSQQRRLSGYFCCRGSSSPEFPFFYIISGCGAGHIIVLTCR